MRYIQINDKYTEYTISLKDISALYIVPEDNYAVAVAIFLNGENAIDLIYDTEDQVNEAYNQITNEIRNYGLSKIIIEDTQDGLQEKGQEDTQVTELQKAGLGCPDSIAMIDKRWEILKPIGDKGYPTTDFGIHIKKLDDDRIQVTINNRLSGREGVGVSKYYDEARAMAAHNMLAHLEAEKAACQG